MSRPAPTTEAEIAERNAESRALGDYTRFLYRRFQKLDIVEMLGKAEAAEPISLRQVYVPVRLGAEDLADETFGEKLRPEEERLPGRDAWEVLRKDSMVLLAGRPGSGKTTLVHAVVMELCGERPSVLRDALHALPLPLILRDLGELAEVGTLAELLELFWQRILPQAAEDGFPLDRSRLERILLAADPDARERPLLLLFDGIDEIGGKETRQRLLSIAAEARQAGYRVLVTGRPDGYRDLDLGEARVQPSYMLPFAWPQIREFISSWYGLRGEWQQKKLDGVKRFLEQIGHPERRNLLVLARRPIFLTLMALVHCTENEMPAGRASLYRKIVDLYLERQRKHRYQPQFRKQVTGRLFKDWPDNEVRLALAHLAWRSQQKLPTDRSREGRRVIWEKDEVLGIFRSQLGAKHLGRFTVLTPEDAEDLLQFFLHPTGLLVEPANGRVQFAHLSFQEYLCAYFLHERFKVSGESYLREELWQRLDQPGWQEVGLLFLHIHSEATNHEGHFALLDSLDLGHAATASLFVAAVTGQELSFKVDERLVYLPVALAVALVHPEYGLGRTIGRLEAWRQPCGELISSLLTPGGTEQALARLATESRDPRLATEGGLAARWSKPPNDGSWDVFYGPGEARAHALLRLVADLGFFTREDPVDPIEDPDLEGWLVEWLASEIESHGPSLLFDRSEGSRETEPVPRTTVLAFELDRLVPSGGRLFDQVVGHLPADVLLLQGESALDPFGDSYSQPIVQLCFASADSKPRLRWALALYERLLLVELGAFGPQLHQKQTIRSRSRSWSLSLSLSLSRSRSRSLSRSRSRSLSLSLSLLRSRSRSLTLSRSLSLSLSLPWVNGTGSRLEALFDSFEQTKMGFPEETVMVVVAAASRYAAADYFAERRENPQRTLARGQSIDPVAPQLGFFEAGDIPKTIVERRFYVALRESLEDFDRLMEDVFPEGLSEAERADLHEQWEIVRSQPWSPQAMIDALLADWPESESSRDISWEATEKRVAEAVDRDLEKLR